VILKNMSEAEKRQKILLEQKLKAIELKKLEA
jgi:hypothetical protein